MVELRDEFLSEEDLALRNMTDEELIAYWNYWLLQAQATNDFDKHTYSHGVFAVEPDGEQDRPTRQSCRRGRIRARRDPC